MSPAGFDGFAGERVVVVRAGDAFDAAGRPAADPALVPLSPALAPGLLRKWLAAPVDRRNLIVLFQALHHRDLPEHWAPEEASALVLETFTRAFEDGDLLLFGLPDLPAPQISPQPGKDRPPSRPPQARRSWIEIELLDEDGRRVATELCVTLPDGSKMRPSFSGFIRLDGIDPGTCDIEFPAIDGREWGPAPGRR